MDKITEQEFVRLCSGISEDSEKICKHNPIGTREEILLWMLLSVLISYLSLSEIEVPCFVGKPTEKTYRDAILRVLQTRKENAFDADKYLNQLLRKTDHLLLLK
jgi:hypothetical protein